MTRRASWSITPTARWATWGASLAGLVRCRADRSGASELLLASVVPLRRLDGDVAEEKLDRLEFPTCHVTQSRACAAKVVRCQLLDAGVRRRRSDDIPEHFRRHPVTPEPPGLVDGSEHATLRDGGGLVHASTADLTLEHPLERRRRPQKWNPHFTPTSSVAFKGS